MLEALDPAERPHVVFVTAYDQYALRAFDAHAVDYVLKPFDAERSARALGRAVLLPVSGVERIEAARNYVTVHAGGRPYRLRTTLDRLEERLDPGAFVRVHRSTIVRVDQATELRAWSHGDYVVVLQGGAKVRLSRRYRDRLQQFLP